MECTRQFQTLSLMLCFSLSLNSQIPTVFDKQMFQFRYLALCCNLTLNEIELFRINPINHDPANWRWDSLKCKKMKLIYYRIQLNYSCEIVVIKLSFVPSLDDQLKAGEGERTWEFSIFNFFTFPTENWCLGGRGGTENEAVGPASPWVFQFVRKNNFW